MADRNVVKAKKAERRRRRVRGTISGTAQVPRLTVAKSLNNTIVQLIDDVSQVTLLYTATNSKTVVEKLGKKTKKPTPRVLLVKNWLNWPKQKVLSRSFLIGINTVIMAALKLLLKALARAD